MSKLGMGNCFPFIRKHQKGNREVNIAILGLDNAGKTTAAKSIQGEPLDDIAPTIGFDNIQFAIGKFNINLYDLGGGKGFRGVWGNYLCEIYGLIYVIDSSDATRMEEARETLESIFSHEKVQGKPVLLLANKQDEETALDEGEIVEILNLVQIVNENSIPCRVERCIAKIGVGKKMDRSIKQGLRWLLSYIDDKWESLDQRITADVEQQKKQNEEEMARKRERVAEIRRQRELERAARGEVEEAPPDVPPGGDPFKPLNLEELKKKELAEKEKKRADAAAKEAAQRANVAPPVVPADPKPQTASPDDTSVNDTATNSLRNSSLSRDDPLPPPVLAGSSLRGQFYSPRGGNMPPASTPDESGGDGFLRPLKPSALPPLEPLEPSTSDAGDEKKRKKKKKTRLGRKHRLAPDPSSNGDPEEGGDEVSGTMGSRTPSRPDLFITEQIYTLDELDEDDVENSTNKRIERNGNSEMVAS